MFIADDLITCCITTSPAPLHPSIDHIATVIDSVRAQLPRAEILVVCDGIRLEDSDYATAYTDYLANLLWACNYTWHNVVPVVSPEFVHQANAVKAALPLVTTPYILFLEHDTPIEGSIPWLGMCDVLQSSAANIIRLHFDVAIHPDHEPLHFGDIEHLHDVPLRRIRVFWARPHLARLDWYTSTLDNYFTADSRTFIEDQLYNVLHCAWADNEPDAWDDWRIWTYMPDGDIKRSGHLDSRGTMTKHPTT